MRHRTTVTIAIQDPILRSDLPGLYRRLCHLLARSETPVAICDVRGIKADAVAVEALARLALAARRNACQVRLRGASKELLELVWFMGLNEVLPSESTPGSK